MREPDTDEAVIDHGAACPRPAGRDADLSRYRGHRPHFQARNTHQIDPRFPTVAADPDGISLLGPMMWWGSRLGFVSREDLRTPGSASFQVGLDMARDQAQTAMAHGWIVTPDNSRESQLRAGFAFVRLGLKAAEQGISMQPMSQLLQEYQEMTDLQRLFLQTVGISAPAHVQMLVRLGHAADPGPSPRRPLDAIMVA